MPQALHIQKHPVPIIGSRNAAPLINQAVKISQGTHVPGLDISQTPYDPQRAPWVARIEQSSDDRVAGALVRDDITRRNEGDEPTAGLLEPARVAESVDHAAEVERVGSVAAEAEVVEEAEGGVDVPVAGAEIVYLPGPERPVRYAHSVELVI